ncbi:MAG: LysM peptidoglycan-binding domain-containing protein [Chlorobi bacterium CHB1]|nr:LysM peptidoglycan-binding domain-containing protein [Chlorobi bacterium CHB1]
MKKVLLTAFCGVVLLLVMAHDNLLMSRLRWLESPQVHHVQKGESLSKLAKEHYGDTDYWRELALVNRAPNPNHIEPDEKILLPAANVMEDLRKARTISSVNSLVDQQQMAAKASPDNGAYSRSEPTGFATAPGILERLILVLVDFGIGFDRRRDRVCALSQASRRIGASAGRG